MSLSRLRPRLSVLCLLAGILAWAPARAVHAAPPATTSLRWASDPTLVYAARSLVFQASASPPVQPPAATGSLHYATAELAGGRRFVLALELAAAGRLWFDADFDGDLGEETPSRLALPPGGRARLALTATWPGTAPASAETLPFEVVLARSDERIEARLSLQAHREGQVVVAGRLRGVRLFDANVDLRFDEAGVDQLALDVDGDGDLSLWDGALDRVDLQRPFRLGAGAYEARVVDAAGSAVEIAATPAQIAPRTPVWRPHPVPPSGVEAPLRPGAFEDARQAYEAWMARPHPHRLIPELERLIRAVGDAGTRKSFAYLRKMLSAWEEVGRARDTIGVRMAIVEAMGNGHYASQGAYLGKLARTTEELPLLVRVIRTLHAAGVPKRAKVYTNLLKKAETDALILVLETHLGYLPDEKVRKQLAKRLKAADDPAHISVLFRALYEQGAEPPADADILAAADDARERMRALGLGLALARRLPGTRALALRAARERVHDAVLQATLVEILGRAGDREAVRALLPLAATGDAGLRTRMVALLGVIRDDAAAAELGAALSDRADAVRGVAAESLAAIGDGKTEAVLRARLDVERSPPVLVSLIRALGRLRSEAAVPGIRKAVTRSAGDEAVLDAATLALARIPTTDEEVAGFFETHLGKRAWDARVATLDALAADRHPLAAGLLIQALQDEDRRVRAAAAQGLGRVRVREAVEPLLAVLEKEEDGRVRHAVAQALFLTTGQYLYDDLTTWKRWYEAEGATFQVPAEIPSLPDTQDVETYGSTFYGVPVASERIVFVLDQSGSMGAMKIRPDAKAEEDRGWTELERAVHETLGVVDTLSEKARVNVVCFETGVHPWKLQPAALSKAARKDLRRWLESLEPEGGTNLYDGLAMALEMKDVEEIYLLSDGRPGAGRYRRTADILREVAKLNRKRRVAIHCISLGVDSALLRALAAENNGNYVRK